MIGLGEVLISAKDLQKRVQALGREISGDYENQNLLLVGILKGAFVFLADLMRAMTIPVQVDFLGVASYGKESESSEEVKVFKDLNEPVAGKNILIVEDIIDSGFTTDYLVRLLEVRSPASIRICALLDKPARRRVPVAIDYCGFEIPDVFVVGYGMDIGEAHRHLPDVYQLIEKKG
jgi:hypoxanthine phosphoribosyltransferase